MTAITVQRRPGRNVFVAGLLGHRAVVEEIALLLVDPDALDMAQKVANAADACRDTFDRCATEAYWEAVSVLAAHLGSVTFHFHGEDLEDIAAAVRDRQMVAAR